MDKEALAKQFEPGSLPGLVAKMAEGIAKAQGALNEDFSANLAKFVKTFTGQGGNLVENQEVFLALLERVAPPRYQFTETVIELRADLAMSGEKDLSVGLSGGAGGFSLQAGFSSSSAFSYRGAASIRTVIHALPSDREVFEKLLDRVTAMPRLDLPSTQEPGEGLGALREMIEEAGEPVTSPPVGSP